VKHGENMRRSSLGYGARRLCRRGLHDVSDETAWVILYNGQRSCKACRQASRDKSHAKERAARETRRRVMVSNGAV
jgi:hypothetical protein